MSSVYKRRDSGSSTDVTWHRTAVSKSDRARIKQQQPLCIWLTGLSGSGKSTLANALERVMLGAGRHTYLLDGDNVRHGLNKDLGMTDADRTENIRRVGELSKLLVDAGLVVISAFISPFRSDREVARALFEPSEFMEVYVSAPLATCEQRDPKGLYQKARQGLIKDFTGIASPYEPPLQPELTVNTETQDIEACVRQVLQFLQSRGQICASDLVR